MAYYKITTTFVINYQLKPKKMEKSKSAETPQVNKQDLLVSREEWVQYLDVKRIGAYNMLDPRARDMTNLNREQWFHIIKNYQYFVDLYGE